MFTARYDHSCGHLQGGKSLRICALKVMNQCIVLQTFVMHLSEDNHKSGGAETCRIHALISGIMVPIQYINQ